MKNSESPRRRRAFALSPGVRVVAGPGGLTRQRNTALDHLRPESTAACWFTSAPARRGITRTERRQRLWGNGLGLRDVILLGPQPESVQRIGSAA